MVWPYWPNKLRTSSSQEEGGDREWSITTKRLEGKGGKVEKLISQSSFVLKGSGWYKTDSAGKGKKDSTPAPACAGSGSKSACAGCPSAAD